MFRTLVVASTTLVFSSIVLAQPDPVERGREPVDFSHDVVPVLRRACIECHGGREAKGGFSMNTRELWLDSGYVDLDSPEDSHLLQLVRSSDEDVQMPPADRPRLDAADRRVLRRWIEAGLPWESGFSFAPRAYEPPLRPRRIVLPPVVQGRTNPIDRIVDAHFSEQQIVRADVVDDRAFLRRVSLDLVGLLPTPDQLESFVRDPSPEKRADQVRALLGQPVAYAEHWLTFYNDLLRNDYSGTGFITGGRRQITAWLYQALVANKPFDQFTRELIAPPTSESQGYIDGIKWRGTVSAGQTVEIQFAQSVSQSFLGINLKCASCHDSFIDRWTLEDAYGLAAVYADRELELHRCDKPTGRMAVASWLFPEIGQVDPSADRQQRQQQLAALMTHPENGRFTRTIVNRLWYRLMGRGIVHPLDAMQTQPWSEDLLDYLAVYLSDHAYDVKKVLELIATSEIYQSRIESIAQADDRRDAFTGPSARRMTAEQFLDAVWQLTGAAPEKYDAPVFRGAVSEDAARQTEVNAQWIWRQGPDSSAAGEQLVFKKEITLTGKVARAGAIVTCDNEFRLFVNGREVERATDWTHLRSVSIGSLLKPGKNRLVVIGKNTGAGPNPAGLFFEARIELDGGESITVISDSSWHVSAMVPAVREGRLGKLPDQWSQADVVPALDVWNRQIEPQARRLLTIMQLDQGTMVRASLIKNNALMRSLGRPTRDQIVSMRPAQLTTLEAIDLANENGLASAMAAGAEKLVQQPWKDASELTRYLFLFALSREPTPGELQAVVESMGSQPSPSEAQDALWAICMLPEFMLIR